MGTYKFVQENILDKPIGVRKSAFVQRHSVCYENSSFLSEIVCKYLDTLTGIQGAAAKRRQSLAAGMLKFQERKRRRSISQHPDNAVIVPNRASVRQMTGVFRGGLNSTMTLTCKMPYCSSTAASRDRENRFQSVGAILSPKVAGRTLHVSEKSNLHELYIEREKIASKSLTETGVSSKQETVTYLRKSKRGKKKKSLRVNCNVKKVGKRRRSKRSRRTRKKRSKRSRRTRKKSRNN